jgi:tRNA pseudouridine38-40 synthase
MPSDSPDFARNLRVLVEYDGTDFVGWQAQDNGPSVQVECERALTQLTQVKPSIRVAGRTDAGVHAFAQVFNFRSNTGLSTKRLASGLNALLPKSISVHAVEDVPLDFDAKRDSQWKRYRYSIYQAAQPAAQLHRRAWHLISPLDGEAMRAAADELTGAHDFESFRAVGCQAKHARREMFAIDIERVARPPTGHLLMITYRADAFCRHMCRILTGTLVEVGRGQRSPLSMRDVLAARSRFAAGVTAPPYGLCLMEVRYALPFVGAEY